MPNMIRSFASGATASLVAKNRTKKLSQPFEDRFQCSRCLNDCIEVPDMIGSFASGATASLVAKNGTTKLSQTFEELQDSNSEFKLIPPKPITGTYFDTNLSRFGLAGLPMVAIFDF